jgi:hypothetical protein
VSVPHDGFSDSDADSILETWGEIDSEREGVSKRVEVCREAAQGTGRAITSTSVSVLKRA